MWAWTGSITEFKLDLKRFKTGLNLHLNWTETGIQTGIHKTEEDIIDSTRVKAHFKYSFSTV